MSNSDPSSYKLSGGFRLIIGLLVLGAAGALGYFELKSGEDPGEVTILVISMLGGAGLLVWFFTSLYGKLTAPDRLTAREKEYVTDLAHSDWVRNLIRGLFGPEDDNAVFLRGIVILGGLFRWMFFFIFSTGTLFVVVRSDTVLSRVLVAGLAVVWCPWIENILLTKLNFKVVFTLKLLATAALIATGMVLEG